MPEATIDHIVSLIVFLAALLIFMGLFNQTIQTAILYQQHRYLATRCSDLLDNMLLNPGSPTNETFHWGKSNYSPTSFGLQDPEFTEYRLSPFSLMRLDSASGIPFYYSRTGLFYSNLTVGFGESMFVPLNVAVNYSAAQTLLGINNTYGFQLTVTPTITVSITEAQSNPLTLAVDVFGTGFPLINTDINYCFMTINASGSYPSYNVSYGRAVTDDTGSTSLNLSIDGTTQSYALVAYANLCGLVGTGYYEHATHTASYVVPLVSDFDERKIVLAHSHDISGNGDSAQITYNATLVLLAEDFTFRQMPLDNCTGTINSGTGYSNLTIPTNNPGTLIITYKESTSESGVIVMPWGIGSMAFPITFGENPAGTNSKEWVASDIRQVIVDGISYQAKLSLWSLEGYTVVT
jgi:hypothetical protein